MINWQEIDLVLLDMDGTLLDLNFDMKFWLEHIPTVYAEQNEIDVQAARDHILPEMRRVQGTLPWYSVDYWSETLGLDVMALNHDMAHLIQPRPGALEFLQKLKSAEIPTWIITNAWPMTVDLKFSKVELSPYIQRVVTSHDLNAPKESALFWEQLFQLHDTCRSRCLFIDDSSSVLQAADEFGIGQLLTIKQPDMSSASRPHNGFRALDHFSQIFPQDPKAQFLK